MTISVALSCILRRRSSGFSVVAHVQGSEREGVGVAVAAESPLGCCASENLLSSVEELRFVLEEPEVTSTVEAERDQVLVCAA
ncbi:MAG: hypothetical protein ACRDKB_08875 [Actinomycetota bacterium]